MSIDESRQLDNARDAVARGDKKAAQQILAAILRKDNRNAEAWLLLADVLEKPEHRIESYRRVLQIDPNDASAKQRLDELMAGRFQKSNVPPAVPPKTPTASTKTPTAQKKTSPIRLGLAVLASLVCVILVAVLAISTGVSTPLPAHTVNDLHDSGNVVNYYIVIDKTFSKSDAQRVIDHYQRQHSGYGFLNVLFFCDKAYATEAAQSVPESEYYAHMLYWYQDDKLNGSGPRFLNDITNPDIHDYPTLGDACK